MANKKLILNTDGCSRHNPGPAAIGVVIKDQAGQTIATISRPVGQTTNNQAEYQAVIAGLEKATELDADTVEVRSDSQLVVEQLNGRYRVKDAELTPLHRRVQELRRRFTEARINYIPREQNREADRLANQAFRRSKPERASTSRHITIRPVATSDYPGLYTVYAEIDAQHARALPDVFAIVPPKTRARHLDSILASDSDVLLVADINGQIAGLIQVGVKETGNIPVLVPRRYAKISELAVRADFQRRGVGTALIAAAEQWALTRQAPDVELDVWEFNKGAKSFYKAMGYETAGLTMVKKQPR